MRKIASLCSVLLMCGLLAFAQQQTVTGKVTDEKGDPIPFASVKVKNGKQGTTADENGNYSIKVAQGTVLTFNSVGFGGKDVTVKGDRVNLSLVRSGQALEEVVVTTALNVKRKADQLSYAIQGIKGDKLTTTRVTDVNQALAGKIAGVQVRSQSGAKLGQAGSTRLRGATGLGDLNPLYVLDGTPINPVDLNPDDIDDLQVLKGPAATALYGQRAEGGVIMVTSKKGRRSKGIGVDISSTYEVDKVGLLPKYQNSYSGGSWLGANSAGTEFQTFTWDASMPAEWKSLDGKQYHLYNDDASWGPRMNGQEYIPWYAWYTGTKYTGKTARLTPQPNNIKQFWNGNNAGQFINNAAISKAGDNYNFRLSYTNINQKGLLPNTSRIKNYLSTSASYDLNSHFTAGVNVNYTNEVLNGEFDDTYGNNSGGGFSQWFHRDLDMNIMKEFRNYRTPDGVLPSWNLNDGNGINGKTSSDPGAFLRPNYWFDHYSYFDNIVNTTNRNRIQGDVNLTYKINNHFKIAGFVRRNIVTSDNEAKVPFVLEQSNDASSIEALSATSANRPIKSTYQTTYNYASEENYEALASYNQKFGNFLVDFNLGANDLIVKSRGLYNSTRGGLTIPNLFALNNSVSTLNYSNNRYVNERRSFYGRGSVNWKDIAIVDFSVRNDISSTLPKAYNSYWYPSVGGSLILTSFISPSVPFISFAKLRASYAQVGSDVGAYDINTIYTLNAQLWNGNALTTTPDRAIDPNIKPTLSSSYEGGIDLRFLKNRLSLSGTYYTQKSVNQIITAPVTGASGFSSKLLNAGEIDKHGIELTLEGTPVQNTSFQWNVSLNLAYASVRIISIADGVHQLYSNGGSYTSTSGSAAYAAGAWQFDKGNTGGFDNKYSQLIGIGIQKVNGVPVLAADGQYVPTTSNVSFGSTLPDYTGGIVNSFTYKNFNLSLAVDFVKGGKYYSLSDFWGKVSGLYDVTANLNDKGIPIRNNVADGGGVHVVGVDASSSHNKIDTYVDAGTYYHQFYNHYINENSIYDLTYVKMREISLSYRLPLAKMGKMANTFQNITISAVCHNAFLFYTANKNIDPSELVGGYGESGQLPPTRSVGVTLKLGF